MSELLYNKKANFNYEIIDTFEAGIELLGNEVKSLKSKQGNMESAYVVVRGGEAFLVSMDIPIYQINNQKEDIDRKRNRKLLLTKKEILKLSEIESKKGLAIIPISIFTKGKKIKVSLGIGKGKKKYDKRETIKKRDSEREIRREMKR